MKYLCHGFLSDCFLLAERISFGSLGIWNDFKRGTVFISFCVVDWVMAGTWSRRNFCEKLKRQGESVNMRLTKRKYSEEPRQEGTKGLTREEEACWWVLCALSLIFGHFKLVWICRFRSTLFLEEGTHLSIGAVSGSSPLWFWSAIVAKTWTIVIFQTDHPFKDSLKIPWEETGYFGVPGHPFAVCVFTCLKLFTSVFGFPFTHKDPWSNLWDAGEGFSKQAAPLRSH